MGGAEEKREPTLPSGYCRERVNEGELNVADRSAAAVPWRARCAVALLLLKKSLSA